jgi:hypothetical protein
MVAAGATVIGTLSALFGDKALCCKFRDVDTEVDIKVFCSVQQNQEKIVLHYY